MSDYTCIVADPPWAFRDRLPGPGRGAAKHYSTVKTSTLCRMMLPPIAPSAVLLLWRVAAMAEEAYQVARAWGFCPKAELVWVKTTPKTMGLAFGMGHYVRGSHEVCLIATRGRVKVLTHRQRSVFYAPVGKHSTKPDEFYRIAETMFAGPYVDLFGRKARPGWDVIGDQAPSPVTLEVSA